MKNLNERNKLLINAYIDNELTIEQTFDIDKLLKNNIEARKFYKETIAYKKSIKIETNIKASSNFEDQLFKNIQALDVKIDRFAVIKRFLDKFTIQHVSYACGTALILFFFMFGVYNVFKPISRTGNAQIAEVQKVIDVVNQTQAAGSLNAERSQNTRPSRQTVVASRRERIARNRRLPRSRPSATIASRVNRSRRTSTAVSDANQTRTRQIFNTHHVRTALRERSEQGVREYYNRNFSNSRRHFRTVLQKAKANSTLYLQAQDYLRRMDRR